jgi:predicted GTPase
MNQDTDIQARSISAGLTKLQELLEKPVATGALELGKNAAAAKEYDVLRRLHRSLLQYLERNGALFYAGVLGHFSAGKSSTINSLLDTWNSKHERVTDLNPTDTTITLITREKNASSLVGVIREGHVTIRLETVDSPLLDEIVLVDSPGTGDPQFIEEIARDFLPICDLILFVFSAASPLDKSDVPLLLELHSRLPFVPIHFVVTRADELRINQDAPLTEANLDRRKTEQFLNTVVARVNTLLTPDVYLTTSFSLVDNKTRFRTQELRGFLRARCNSSNPQAHVSMHLNKLHFYRSSAKSLRVFFSGIVEKKLSELTKIVEAANKNIEKYQQLVQISNSNLTRTWMEHAATIDVAASKTTEAVRPATALPLQYTELRLVSAKRVDLVNEINRSAKYHAGSISSSTKAEINGALQQHLYSVQQRLGETPVQELSAEVHSSIQAPPVALPSLAQVQSLSSLLRQGEEMREAEADALRDAAADLRRTLSVLQEQIGQRAFLASPERAIKSATDSLKVDLNNFFQTVELYRSGVFSHTTKESIATLGIGQQLDILETEITEDDQEVYATSAGGDLFPGAEDLIRLAENKGREIAQKAQVAVDEARAIRIDRPESNQPALEGAITSARESFQTDLRDALQSEADRFCGGLSVTVANLIVSARTKCDAGLTLLRKARRKRYAIAFAITAIVYLVASFAYHHSGYPAPASLLGEVTVHIGSGLLLEAIVLLGVKARENAPKMLSQTREEIQVKLKDDVRLALESQLSALTLNALNEQVIANRLARIYLNALDLPPDAWRTRAKDTLSSLRKISSTYSDLRTTYLGLVEQVRQDGSQYFGDSPRNLAVLNAIAARIKAEAIEPSFDLLAATRAELLSVKKEVDSVVFD